MSESWKEVITSVAKERAVGESQERWGQGPGERPRFNYRLEHVKAVVAIARGLAHRLGGDLEVVEAAAWLHDLSKSCDHWPEGDSHGAAGAEEARRLLERTDFPQGKVALVCEAIAKHPGLYKEEPIEPLAAAILWDADKLSKLGATSLVHFLCSAPSSEEPPTTESILAQGEEWLSLAARIASSMTTAPAKEMAQERHETVKVFYQQLKKEMGWDRG